LRASVGGLTVAIMKGADRNPLAHTSKREREKQGMKRWSVKEARKPNGQEVTTGTFINSKKEEEKRIVAKLRSPTRKGGMMTAKLERH